MLKTLCAALVVLAAGWLAPAPRGPASGEVEALLARQTQELLDAVTAGDPKVWDRYLDPAMTYSDENGDVKTKAELLGEIQPLPKGVSGELKVTNFAIHVHGDTAVATHVADERSTYHGQEIHSRYGQTDTWQRTGDGWRLIATHVGALRTDPPAVALSPARLDEYVGVYALTPEISYTIRRDGDALVAVRTGRREERLAAEVADMFFVPGLPRMRTVFQRGPDGRVTGFVERRESWDVVWKRAR